MNRDYTKGASSVLWLIIAIVVIGGAAGATYFASQDDNTGGSNRPGGTNDDPNSVPQGEFLQDGDPVPEDLESVEQAHDGEGGPIGGDASGVTSGTSDVGGDASGDCTAENPDCIDNFSGSDLSGGPNRLVAVTYTDNGFDPETVVIKAGDSVLWLNKSSLDMWVGSDIHPTHTVYPDSDIQKCFDGSDTSTIFDQCGSSADYMFNFSEVGEWEYHNHKKASHGGTVIVEEFVGL